MKSEGSSAKKNTVVSISDDTKNEKQQILEITKTEPKHLENK